MIMATTETTIGTATVRVWPTGQVDGDWKNGWAYSIRDHAADGAVTTIATGDDLYGHGDGAEMLRSLLSFLSAEAEAYSGALSRGDDGPADGFIFSVDVAEWADQHADALAMAACELDDEDED